MWDVVVMILIVMHLIPSSYLLRGMEPILETEA